MLQLYVGGQVFEGWTEVEVTRAVDSAVSSFSIGLTELWATRDRPWVITVGAPCKVFLDDDLVITGYVDNYNPSYGAAEHAVRVTGRSRTEDAVDCSAVVPGGQFSGYDVGQIARTLCATVGVGVDIETDLGAPFPDVQVQQGESIFELVERLCRLRAILVCDAPSGNLVLTRAGKGSAAGSLRRGVNILSASATLSVAERYSDYIVKGQQAPSDLIPGVQATETVGNARDLGVTRYRPKLVVAEGQSDLATTAERAKWEMLTRAANGVRATITVQGWRNIVSGQLWMPNQLVQVTDNWLGIDRHLLIASVAYRLSESGTTCELNLAPPEAFTPEPADPNDPNTGGDSWSILDGAGVMSPPVGVQDDDE